MESEKKALQDVFVLGIEGGTYEEMLALAKQQGKSVVEVASEALKKHIADSKGLKESREPKLLCEG